MSGYKPGDDLNDREAFLHAVGRQLLKVLRPAHPGAKAHPPRVAEPEERRPVDVLEMALVGRDADGAVLPQRVVSLIGRNLQYAATPVQITVVARDGPVSVAARQPWVSIESARFARPPRRPGPFVRALAGP